MSLKFCKKCKSHLRKILTATAVSWLCDKCYEHYDIDPEDAIIYKPSSVDINSIIYDGILQYAEKDPTMNREFRECKECKDTTIQIRIHTKDLRAIYKCEECLIITRIIS